MAKEEARTAQNNTHENLNDDVPENTTASEPGDQEAQAPEPEEMVVDGQSLGEGGWQTKANEYLEGWQRTRAEFANYKKRTDRELKEGHRRGALEAIAKLLPIVDDFERAVSNIPADLQDNAWVKGTVLALPKLQKLLNEFDIEEIDPVGEVFDPNKHEAIGMDDSTDVESGHVTMTLQKGYMSGDRVLRPALVRVAN